MVPMGPRAGSDQFHLRSANDLELLGGNAHPMAGIPIDTGLTRSKDQVVDRVHRVETGRLLGVPVVEPDVRQLSPLAQGECCEQRC